MRLIDADKLKAHYSWWDNEEKKVFDDIVDVQPTVERPKGHWVNKKGEPVPFDKEGLPARSCWCSECGDWLGASDEYGVKGNFCPNCGADMR